MRTFLRIRTVCKQVSVVWEASAVLGGGYRRLLNSLLPRHGPSLCFRQVCPHPQGRTSDEEGTSPAIIPAPCNLDLCTAKKQQSLYWRSSSFIYKRCKRPVDYLMSLIRQSSHYSTSCSPLVSEAAMGGREQELVGVGLKASFPQYCLCGGQGKQRHSGGNGMSRGVGLLLHLKGRGAAGIASAPSNRLIEQSMEIPSTTQLAD